MHKANFTAQLTNKAAVEQAALAIGCTHSRGREKGTGSIRAMLEEIGQGEVLLMFHPFDDVDTMRSVACRVRETAVKIEDKTDDARLLIEALAAALEHAAEIKEKAG